MDDPLQARPQRLRLHLRRPNREEHQLKMADVVTPFLRQTPRTRIHRRASYGFSLTRFIRVFTDARCLTELEPWRITAGRRPWFEGLRRRGAEGELRGVCGGLPDGSPFGWRWGASWPSARAVDAKTTPERLV
jgi:hypothetical protein